MAGARRVVVVGIPGVGKTTLLKSVVDRLRSRGRSVSMCSFGTTMLEEARRDGITDRDMLRNLPTSEQRRLQRGAAESIASRGGDVVVIDTHAFVNTGFGHYPGLPEWVIRILEPAGYILLSAKPEEIYNRRMNDPTRNRDRVNILSIKQELGLQTAMVSACSVVSGAPLKSIMNREGRMGEAIDAMVEAVEAMGR